MTVVHAASDFMTPNLKELTTIETKDKSNWTTMKFWMSWALQEFAPLSFLPNLPENTKGGASEKSSNHCIQSGLRWKT